MGDEIFQAPPRSQTPTTFPRFSDLPKEIRLMIWEASFGSRIVHVETKQLKRGYCSRVWSDKANDVAGNEDFYDLVEEVKDPGPYGAYELPGRHFGPLWSYGLRTRDFGPMKTSLACREAFEVSIKYGAHSFGSCGSFPTIWFNFDIDTLCMDWETLVQIWDGEVGPFERPDAGLIGLNVSHVSHLALTGWPISPGHVEAEDYCELLEPFVNLKKLTLATPATDKNYDNGDLVFVELEDWANLCFPGPLDLAAERAIADFPVRFKNIDGILRGL